MCQFFSFVTAGKKPFFFDWPARQQFARQQFLSKEPNVNPDSHASIAELHNLDEDKCNKYEYNPLTKLFCVDQINGRSDERNAEQWVRKLDWTRIIAPLRVGPIIHPLKITSTRLSKKDKNLLIEWASASVSFGVRDSVWPSASASASASVRHSVWHSAGAGVWDSICSSVWDSIRSSVWDSVWHSVCKSVRDSRARVIRDSVGASVWGYVSSFFDIVDFEKFQPCVKLWKRGFVASFDSETWRLHKGGDAKIVYEWKPIAGNR